MKIVKQKSKNVDKDDPQHSMPQVWMCLRCEKQRQWGVGPSQIPTRLSYLLCAEGHGVTRHVFVGLDSDRQIEKVK